MEAKCSSETSVHFHWTTRRYIQEESFTYVVVRIGTADLQDLHADLKTEE
jgi:hypothetical protein